MFLLRRWRNVPLTTSVRKRLNSTKPEPAMKEKIEIPNRIHRRPTDILNALSSTVGIDPTAPHYKYQDDPFLIPTSNTAKRVYAMSQESGRKAARWVRQQHADLFQHSDAEPPIEAFAPQMVFTKDSQVDETTLRNLIKTTLVSDSIFVYKLLKEKGQEISDETKQDFMELLCFYNHEDPLPEEFLEERWFRQWNASRDRLRKTWKDGEMAEEIFNELQTKDSKAYSAMIRGMCKYCQAERGWALFQETVEKQIEVDTATFNALLTIVNFLKESPELRWELCRDILSQMKDRKLHPNLETLNSVLYTISGLGNYRLSRAVTLNTLSEFKKLNIEPSLASWYYVLITFCRERGPVSHVLVDILNEIEGKEFQISDPKDVNFFVTAMNVCRNHLHDKNLAKRVDKLLHLGQNYDFIGDSYKESTYYRHFFALLCETETLDAFMEKYDLLVPNVYTPEAGIMEEILKMINTNGALEFIPRMWSDIIIFDYMNRENLINQILSIMFENKPSSEIPNQCGLDEKFSEIAWDIFSRVEMQLLEEKRSQKLTLSGQTLGNILSILSRGKQYENSVKVFNKMDKEQHKVSGIPSTQNLLDFIDLCIIERVPSMAINCLQYAAENDLNAPQLAMKIKSGFSLNDAHISKIKSIVGETTL